MVVAFDWAGVYPGERKLAIACARGGFRRAGLHVMEAVGLTDTAPAQVADERSAGAYEAWRNRLAEMWRQAAPAALGH